MDNEDLEQIKCSLIGQHGWHLGKCIYCGTARSSPLDTFVERRNAQLRKGELQDSFFSESRPTRDRQ